MLRAAPAGGLELGPFVFVLDPDQVTSAARREPSAGTRARNPMGLCWDGEHARKIFQRQSMKLVLSYSIPQSPRYTGEGRSAHGCACGASTTGISAFTAPHSCPVGPRGVRRLRCTHQPGNRSVGPSERLQPVQPPDRRRVDAHVGDGWPHITYDTHTIIP